MDNSRVWHRSSDPVLQNASSGKLRLRGNGERILMGELLGDASNTRHALICPIVVNAYSPRKVAQVRVVSEKGQRAGLEAVRVNRPGH